MTGEVPHHILGADDVSQELLQEVCDRAAYFEAARATREGRRVLADAYPGESAVLCFEEASTRTLVSSAAASAVVGIKPILLTKETSAMVKGESLERTALTLGAAGAGYIVMRLEESGAVARAASESFVPVINGGDGMNEHPTQGMLDVATARKHLGTLDGTTWAIFGDLRYARTIHSFMRMLGKSEGVELRLVAPEGLGITDETRQDLTARGLAHSETSDLREAVRGAHGLYGVRNQKERYDQKDGPKPIVLDHGVLAAMEEQAIILHPGPACDEIPSYVYKDPRAIFAREQVETGVNVRAALFDLLMGSYAYEAAQQAEEQGAIVVHERTGQLVA